MTVFDYINMTVAVVACGLTTYWVIVDKSLDWTNTLAFSPAFAITLFLAATFGFLTFVVLALRSVIKAS